MASPRVLLTGFGPFPGVPDNPSAWLAETLAVDDQGLDWQLHAEVLPTEWDAVALRTTELYAALQPHVLVHFGLCRNARGFRIERSAHNRAFARADMRGALPRTRIILPQGPDRLDTAFPVTLLTAHLRTRGLIAAPSRSAGRYLCNFLYYRSLAWASQQDRPAVALFVHIPQRSAHGGPFDETELLRGARETLRFALDFAGAQACPKLIPAGSALTSALPFNMKDA